MLKICRQDEVQAVVDEIIAGKSLVDDLPQEKAVREIISQVRKHGDAALLNYAQQFDQIKMTAGELKISQAEIDAAYKKVSPEFITSLTKAIQNITAYHRKQKVDEWFETLPLDVLLGQRVIPIEKVGLYVPGGRAVYPSSVVMNAIPAQVAGVKEIILVSPPVINPHVLVAASELGIKQIFQVGGAQAIAALAYGTESIPRVDKIVGPGNIYVALAKKLLFGVVGIESLAGPSDVLIIADGDAEAEFIAADLLAQVE